MRKFSNELFDSPNPGEWFTLDTSTNIFVWFWSKSYHWKKDQRRCKKLCKKSKKSKDCKKCKKFKKCRPRAKGPIQARYILSILLCCYFPGACEVLLTPQNHTVINWNTECHNMNMNMNNVSLVQSQTNWTLFVRKVNFLAQIYIFLKKKCNMYYNYNCYESAFETMSVLWWITECYSAINATLFEEKKWNNIFNLFFIWNYVHIHRIWHRLENLNCVFLWIQMLCSWKFD